VDFRFSDQMMAQEHQEASVSFFAGKDPEPGDKFSCDALKAVIVPPAISTRASATSRLMTALT
jgi:hypothetical protein